LCALSMAGCADEPSDTSPPPDDDTTGDETVQAPPPEPPAEVEPAEDDFGERSPILTQLLGRPNIDVYVTGPEKVGDAALTAETAGTFETTVRVVNTGEGPLDVERVHVRFEIWDEDGGRAPCTDVDDTRPPGLVMDDGSHLHRALARCEFAAAGEYEVRTYVSFEAEELAGDFDVERHYAGRTEVTVGG